MDIYQKIQQRAEELQKDKKFMAKLGKETRKYKSKSQMKKYMSKALDLSIKETKWNNQ